MVGVGPELSDAEEEEDEGVAEVEVENRTRLMEWPYDGRHWR